MPIPPTQPGKHFIVKLGGEETSGLVVDRPASGYYRTHADADQLLRDARRQPAPGASRLLEFQRQGGRSRIHLAQVTAVQKNQLRHDAKLGDLGCGQDDPIADNDTAPLRVVRIVESVGCNMDDPVFLREQSVHDGQRRCLLFDQRRDFEPLGIQQSRHSLRLLGGFRQRNLAAAQVRLANHECVVAARVLHPIPELRHLELPQHAHAHGHRLYDPVAVAFGQHLPRILSCARV